MTSVIFGHDHYFFRDSEHQVYSPGGLPSNAWDRYLEHFSDLTVLGRDGGIIPDIKSNMILSSRESVRFRLFPNLSDPKSFALNYVGVRREISALVRKHDAVIARLGSRFGMMLVSEARRQKKPYLIELVGCPRDALWYHGRHLYKFFIPYKVLAVRNAVRYAPYVLYVTKNFLQERYPSTGVSVGCSNVQIPSQAAEIGPRAKRKNRSAIKIGLIGNYSARYKGIADAIRCLPIVLSDYPNASLEVVGGGDASEYVSLADKLGVRDHVTFRGRLPSGSAIYSWIDSIDVYLQPSHTEGLPRALIEAMSRACPSIATKVGGIPELLPDDLLVDKGDHEQLAEKIISLISNDVWYQTVSHQLLSASAGYNSAALSEKRRVFYGGFYEFVCSRGSVETVCK